MTSWNECLESPALPLDHLKKSSRSDLSFFGADWLEPVDERLQTERRRMGESQRKREKEKERKREREKERKRERKRR